MSVGIGGGGRGYAPGTDPIREVQKKQGGVIGGPGYGGARQTTGATGAPGAGPAIDFDKVIGSIFGSGSSASTAPVSRTWTGSDGSWQGSDGNFYNKDGTPKNAGGKGSQKPKAPGSGGAGPGPDGLMVNQAQRDPRLETLGKAVEQRVTNPDMSSRRAIDAAGLAIRDLASGQEKEAQVGAAMRGVSGSGMESAAQADIQRDTRGKVAGAARDITLGRERDQDAFLLGSTGALGAAGDAARSDRALTQQAWIENEQNRRAQEQADLSRQLAVLNLLGNLGGL